MLVNIKMLIREVTPTRTTESTEPQTPAQQRVTALRTQLDQARDGVKRERLAKRQLALNQARAEIV
jgi:hypothetical protein